jgi:hypothetical protein
VFTAKNLGGKQIVFLGPVPRISATPGALKVVSYVQPYAKLVQKTKF